LKEQCKTVYLELKPIAEELPLRDDLGAEDKSTRIMLEIISENILGRRRTFG
jgi:hypothetical protein